MDKGVWINHGLVIGMFIKHRPKGSKEIQLFLVIYIGDGGDMCMMYINVLECT